MVFHEFGQSLLIMFSPEAQRALLALWATTRGYRLNLQSVDRAFVKELMILFRNIKQAVI